MTEISTSTTAAAPAEAPTFESLGMSKEVLAALSDMGFLRPTPVQLAAYEPVASGKDLIVQARTGTGKTAAFGIPLVDRRIRKDGGTQALILAPTRELALQSARELDRISKHKGTRTAAVYGGAPMERQVRELAEGAEIVSGTPGRVLDHLRRGSLRGEDLRVLILDEADEMLSMGFAKELNAIVELLPKSRQTLLFSATIDDQVKRMSQRYMREPETISLSSDSVGAQTIAHFVYIITGAGKTRDLARILEIEDPESAVIFCNMKSTTEQVAEELQNAGFNADVLNGDLPQSEREKVLERTRRGQLRYLVATDVAARGIDISHLTHVVNYDFPDALESYVHRTGRTGRAGRTGTAVSLITPQDLGQLYYLRLQYKIFPIERALASTGELRTRKELDRIELLESGFAGEPAEFDRALARRLLAHDEAERLVAGLVRAVLGGATATKDEETIDEQAAAQRRARAARPVDDESRVTDRFERPRRGGEDDAGDSGRRRRRRRERDESDVDASAPTEPVDTRGARDRRSDAATRPVGRAAEVRSSLRDGASEVSDDAVTTNGAIPAEPRAIEARPSVETPRDEAVSPKVSVTRVRRDERPRDERPRDERPRDERPRDERPRHDEPRDERPRDERPRHDEPRGERRPEEEEDDGRFVNVFVNLGRRDGTRVVDLLRIFETHAGIGKDGLGRIRVRDRHSFVGVPRETVEAVATKVNGQRHGEKDLVVEVARNERTAEPQG